MDVQNLVPAVLYDGQGNALAPQTSTNQVFTGDGRTVTESLKELKNTSNEVIYTHIQILESAFDQQCIFNLKYPIKNYDLEKFPIVVVARDEVIDPSCYKINSNYPNDDQILFNTSKVPGFKTGETAIVIMHYSKTIYNGNNVNADTVNNIYMQIGVPDDGAELPDPSIYFDFAGSQIVYFSNGERHYFPIGSSKIMTASKEITTSTQTISLAELGYNRDEDVLMVYENNTHISEGDYYTIDDNLIMRRVNNVVWQATAYEPITFDFLIQKRAQAVVIKEPQAIVNNIYDGSVTMSKLSLELQEQLKKMQEEIAELKK